METQKTKQGDENLHASLLQRLPGMVYRRSHDRLYTLQFAGDGCRALTGFEPEDLLQNETVAYGDLIHPEDRAAAARKIDDALASRGPFVCLYRLMTATGREKWVLDNGQGVYDAGDNLVALEGIIIDNTERVLAFQQMERRLLERSRKLAALHETLSVATTSGDLQTAMRRALRRALAAAGGDVGFIHLADDGGTTLQLLTHEGLSPTAASALQRVPAGDSAIGWVATRRRPLLLRQGGHDRRLAALLATGCDAGAFLGVPIPAGGRICGVLTVLSRDESRFGNEESELLAAVGEQLGLVVENMRLRRQAEQLLVMEERNRLARELHDSVTQALYSVTLFAEAGHRLLQRGHVEQAGTLGYLLKEASPEELVQAIRRANQGQSSLHPDVALKIVQELHRPAPSTPAPEPLTEREVDVLKLVAKGMSNVAIAADLTVSERTVRTHISNILAKLHLANRTQATLYALRQGLASLEESAPQDSE